MNYSSDRSPRSDFLLGSTIGLSSLLTATLFQFLKSAVSTISNWISGIEIVPGLIVVTLSDTPFMLFTYYSSSLTIIITLVILSVGTLSYGGSLTNGILMSLGYLSVSCLCSLIPAMFFFPDEKLSAIGFYIVLGLFGLILVGVCAVSGHFLWNRISPQL